MLKVLLQHVLMDAYTLLCVNEVRRLYMEKNIQSEIQKVHTPFASMTECLSRMSTALR